MIIKHSNIPELIFKKITQNISNKDLKKLEAWINQSPENKAIYKETINHDNINSALKYYFKYDVDSAWIKTEKRLRQVNRKTKQLTIKIIRYAAAITIPLLVAGYIFLLSPKPADSIIVDIPFKPGNQKAILTLSNGEIVAIGKNFKANNIKISESSLITDSSYTLIYGPEITSPKIIEYNTLQTPKGGEYSLILADGSKAWLNADSKLKYPISFSDSERKIFLEGEAYFEVTTNKNKPFIVHTNGYDITVLGTSFNVMAYNNEKHIATTLLEGSVKINQTELNNTIYLTPGQQAILNKDSNIIETATVDTYQYISWKDGLFVFKSEPLASIANKFSRWYNCEIQFTDESIKNTKFTGTLNKHTSLGDLLNTISQTCLINFSVNANNVLIISKQK